MRLLKQAKEEKPEETTSDRDGDGDGFPGTMDSHNGGCSASQVAWHRVFGGTREAVVTATERPAASNQAATNPQRPKTHSAEYTDSALVWSRTFSNEDAATHADSLGTAQLPRADGTDDKMMFDNSPLDVACRSGLHPLAERNRKRPRPNTCALAGCCGAPAHAQDGGVTAAGVDGGATMAGATAVAAAAGARVMVLGAEVGREEMQCLLRNAAFSEEQLIALVADVSLLGDQQARISALEAALGRD